MTELLFVILFLSLFDRRVADPLNRLFWAPYFCFVTLSFLLLVRLENFVSKKVNSMEFGYRFKICIKAIYGLIILNREDLKMKGVRFDKPHDYVCKCDKDLPVEEQTIFKVQFLDAKQQAKLRDMMYSVSGIGNSRSEKFLTGSAALKALEFGLKGWKNFKYEDSEEEIPFSQENISCIPPIQRDELANYIRGVEEGEI